MSIDCKKPGCGKKGITKTEQTHIVITPQKTEVSHTYECPTCGRKESIKS